MHLPLTFAGNVKPGSFSGTKGDDSKSSSRKSSSSSTTTPSLPSPTRFQNGEEKTRKFSFFGVRFEKNCVQEFAY